MNIQEKFSQARSQIKTGDIVLYSRVRGLARIIRWADNAYYNHAGVAYWIGDRLFTIDAWDNGTELVPLSRRIKVYKDFCVIRKTEVNAIELRTACNNLMNRVERDEPYGWAELVRRLIWMKVINKNNRLAWIENWINKKRRPVCSDVARDFGVDFGIKCYKDLVLPTPEDLKRFADKSEVQILWDDKK